MKILEIHIFGYGKLENVCLAKLGDFTVFFGENEAGKTTIMSFIHGILFGFPTKQQAELRYEPKTGAKYGGQLVIDFEEKGIAVVERVKGKAAAGDVSVRLQNGTVGEEDLLKELLSSVDKTLYQSIFSFNLTGLQNVHQLKSEDLGKFLFSTGTVGSDRLLTVENSLQKELDARFKPGGKKPVLNEKMREVKEIYDRLKRAELQNEEYGDLLKKKDHLQKKILGQQKLKTSIQGKLQKLEEWERLVPVVRETELVEKALDQLSNNSFPIDGLNRLEQLNLLVIPIEGQIQSLQKSQEKLVSEVEQLLPDNLIIEKAADIQAASEKLSLYEALKEEQGEWRIKLERITNEIESLKERLHVSIGDDQIETCNTSIFMKEKTAEAQRKNVRLKERKAELDSLFNEEKEALEKIEAKIEQLSTGMLPPKERAIKEEKLRTAENKESIEKDLFLVQEKLNLLQTALLKENQQSKQNLIQLVFFSFIFVLLLIWGLWTSQWPIVLFSGIGGVFLLYLAIKRKEPKNSPNIKEQMKTLKEKEKVLMEQISKSVPLDIGLLKEQLEQDATLREQVKLLKVKWEQQKDQYEKVIRSYENWEQETAAHEKLLISLGGELHLPDDISLNYLHDAFLLISQIKDCIRAYKSMQQEVVKKEESLTSIHQSLLELISTFHKSQKLQLREGVSLLRTQLREEMDKKIKYGEKTDKLHEVNEQLSKLKNEYDHLQKEKMKLFQSTHASNEEEYRLAGKEHEKRNDLLRRKEELIRQMELSSLIKEEIMGYKRIKDLQVEMKEIALKIADIDQQIQLNQEELADTKHKIGLLEDGGGYTELLHTYKQEKSELEMEAKEWARFALAKAMLKQTVDRFRNEHLPNMLHRAEEYLSFLTDGSYIRIIPKEDSSGFVIERKDRIMFQANELSQATTEQVYVSLRLALAVTLYKNLTFPIIIDDSFVNFDHVRTGKVMELLKNMKDNQILFFTCHQHLLTYFNENQVCFLEGQVSMETYS